MAESTLTLGFLDFANEASFEWGSGAVFTALAGYSATPPTVPHTGKALIVDNLVQEAYRMMLNPPVLITEQGQSNHSWRSLKPTTTIQVWPAQAAVTGRNLTFVTSDSGSLTTMVQTATGTFYPSMAGQKIVADQGTFTITDYNVSDQIRINAYYADSAAWGAPGTWTMVAGNYGMPANFGGAEHPLSEVDASQHRHPIPWTGELEIRQQRDYVIDRTGYPRFAALTPRPDGIVTTIDGADEANSKKEVTNRFDMSLWPIPDAVYTLRYRFIQLVNKLTVAAPYPIGGMMFSELMMAAVRATVEKKRHKTKGVEYGHFMETLAAAVEHDRHATATEYFGNSGEPSTTEHGRHQDDSLIVTVNGLIP